MDFKSILKIIKSFLPDVNIKFDFSKKTTINIGSINISSDELQQAQLHLDRSTEKEAIEYDAENKKLRVNLARANKKIKQEIYPLLRAALHEDDITYLENETTAELEDFRVKESNANFRGIIEYLQKIIPLKDIPIWRAALYIRQCSEDYKQTKNLEQKKLILRNISILKGEIRNRFGKKGSNIANLCSANYISEWIQPLYEEIKASPTITNEQAGIQMFQWIYRIVVEELRYTIFVSSQDTVGYIFQQIELKLQYGLNFLNIHGIGYRNIRIIEEVAKKIENDSKSKYTITQKTAQGGIILLRLGLKQNDVKPV
jgi:hypothetical protein